MGIPRGINSHLGCQPSCLHSALSETIHKQTNGTIATYLFLAIVPFFIKPYPLLFLTVLRKFLRDFFNKRFTVQHDWIRNRCDHRKILRHLSRLDRIERRLLQLFCKCCQFFIAIQFSSLFNAPVHAKIVATEFVEVSSPFRCL